MNREETAPAPGAAAENQVATAGRSNVPLAVIGLALVSAEGPATADTDVPARS